MAINKVALQDLVNATRSGQFNLVETVRDRPSMSLPTWVQEECAHLNSLAESAAEMQDRAPKIDPNGTRLVASWGPPGMSCPFNTTPSDAPKKTIKSVAIVRTLPS